MCLVEEFLSFKKLAIYLAEMYTAIHSLNACLSTYLEEFYILHVPQKTTTEYYWPTDFSVSGHATRSIEPSLSYQQFIFCSCPIGSVVLVSLYVGLTCFQLIAKSSFLTALNKQQTYTFILKVAEVSVKYYQRAGCNFLTNVEILSSPWDPIKSFVVGFLFVQVCNSSPHGPIEGKLILAQLCRPL